MGERFARGALSHNIEGTYRTFAGDVMLCGSCGSNNSEGRGFCGQCGTALEFPCAVCGAVNRADEKYCGKCGKSLTGSSASAARSGTSSQPGAGPGHPQSIAHGRYRVRRMLGQGGSKIAYLAHDEMLDRDVAVSLFRVEGLDDAGRARILREARAMGRLGDHSHIVGIYDIGEAEQGRPYIVSQYVPGGSLSDLLRRSPDHRLPVAEAIRIAEQLCHGIEYAHSLGIIHRDIKPANVFIANDGTPLLGDFGLAVAPDQSRITARGIMVGTAAYLPPEQALGRALEPRSDLYSLGAMLYELLTGRPPFIGDDLMAIVSQHVNAIPDPPSIYVSGIPPALDALVLKLLAKSPSERPLSAAAVRESLHTIAGSSRGAMDQLASSVMVERPNLSNHAAPDGTVSIMFSDIENSTSMIERMGDLRAQEMIRMHNRAIREQVAKYGGYEVKSMGDGFMIAFASARRALLCAIEIQRDLADYCATHPDAPLRVRIGLNTGEAIREAGDFFGKTVVLAARIGAAARGGEILVSSTFKSLTDSAGDIRFDPGRDLTLKGLSGAHRVFRVLWAADEKKCPRCARPIPASAASCPHCRGKVVELAPAHAIPDQRDAQSARAEQPARERTLASARLETLQFDGSPIGDATSTGRNVLRSLTASPARIAGSAVAILVVAFALIWHSVSGGHHRATVATTSSTAGEGELPTKTVSVAGSARRSGKTLPEKSRLASRDQPAATRAHESPAPLPRSKTTIISTTASAADDAAADTQPNDASGVTQCRPTPHRYNIQVDAVDEKADADEMVHRIMDLGFNACEKAITVSGQRQYAVRVGPYKTEDEAAAAQEKLHEQYKAAYSDPATD